MPFARAKAFIETSASPVFLTTFADEFDLTETDDLRVRVRYMGTLGLVLRTPKGVIRQD